MTRLIFTGAITATGSLEESTKDKVRKVHSPVIHTLWQAVRRDQGLAKFTLTCRRRPASKSRRFLRGPEKNREWYAGNRNRSPHLPTPAPGYRDKISSLCDSAFFRRAHVKRFTGPRFSAASREVRSTREIGADSADLARERIQTASFRAGRTPRSINPRENISRFAKYHDLPFRALLSSGLMNYYSPNEVCQPDSATRINTRNF